MRIERRNLWKRARGFFIGVCVFSLILVAVPAFLHWLKCWKCRKEMADQITRAEKITRAELVQNCTPQHGSWLDKCRLQQVCEQQIPHLPQY